MLHLDYQNILAMLKTKTQTESNKYVQSKLESHFFGIAQNNNYRIGAALCNSAIIFAHECLSAGEFA